MGIIDHIYWYVDDKGNNPVCHFISLLPKGERVKVFAYVNELKLQGHNLRRPMADYLGHGIYELRPKHNRVFYFFYMKNNVVIVHAMRKKTDRIPGCDLQLCLKRKFIIESSMGFVEVLNEED